MPSPLSLASCVGASLLSPVLWGPSAWERLGKVLFSPVFLATFLNSYAAGRAPESHVQADFFSPAQKPVKEPSYDL